MPDTANILGRDRRMTDGQNMMGSPQKGGRKTRRREGREVIIIQRGECLIQAISGIKGKVNG